MEKDLLQSQKILSHVKENAIKGNVESVIATIDKYINENGSAMHIGDNKGSIVDSIVQECNPSYAVELGAFFGYSALRISRLLKPGSVFYSIEANPECAKISKEMIEFAGMSDKAKVLVGKSYDILPEFGGDTSYGVSTFDFVFIDHWKDLYLPDLKLMENLKLLKKGTVVLADNVVYPGTPDYLEYVRNNPSYKCTTFPCKLQRKDIEDALEKSVYLCD